MNKAQEVIETISLLLEKKGKKVKVPDFKRRKDAVDFLNKLGLDDTVIGDLFDPDTGEIWMEPGQTKRKLLKAKAKGILSIPSADLDFMAMTYKKNRDGYWEDESDFYTFYHVIEKPLEKMVDEPEKLLVGDYDIYVSFPVKIKRKDGKPFTEVDMWNIEEFIKFKEDGFFSGNIGIQFSGREGSKIGSFEPTFK